MSKNNLRINCESVVCPDGGNCNSCNLRNTNSSIKLFLGLLLRKSAGSLLANGETMEPKPAWFANKAITLASPLPET